MRPSDVIAQRYRLDRQLGSGGMGEVWAATHVVTQKAVALKLLRPRDDDAQARRRVLREARAACAVHHPSVVSVHDVVEADDGAPVLVMDLLEGESLRGRLERERVVPLLETRRIVETVLDALDVAHAAGIVHRDLKPDNLFLLRDGRVMLLDFGVAKLVASDGPANGSGTLTATGAMVGTPVYMAPEQAFGEPIDGRADLWAVGILMYECLAGEPPTKGENLGQVLRILSTGKIAPLRDRAPEVPASIAAVVDALLAIDAAARPPTARAALEMLRAAAVDDGPPSSREPHAKTRPPAKALSAPPPRTIATTRAAPSRARRAILGTAIGSTLVGVVTAVILRATLSEPRRIAPAASAPMASGAAAVTASAPPSSSAPAPEETASAATSARPAVSTQRPAPLAPPHSSAQPVRAAKPSASAAPSAAPSSSAPRLLTDVPF